MLITDVCSFGSLSVLEESSKSGNMVLTGLLAEAEVFNRNNRKYSRDILEREVGRLQNLIQERKFVGELDHPSSPTVNLKNAACLITELCMEGNKVIGNVELLNTPAGKVAQDLVRDGVRIGMSSRATGSLIPIEEGKFRVGENLTIMCWDIVADPSCVGANPTLMEGACILESVEYGTKYNKYREEQVYIQFLREALEEIKK